VATISTEIEVAAPAEEVWGAVRDVGAVHDRLARGFVVKTRLDGDARLVTFNNGITARKLIVTVGDEARRLAYAAVGGRARHHNAAMQVRASASGSAVIEWTTDVLPDEVAPMIASLVDRGADAIRATLGSRSETHTKAGAAMPAGNGQEQG